MSPWCFSGGAARLLAEHREPLDEDRELARLRAAQFAVDADHVAQVEALGQLPAVADLLQADEKLNLAGHVADVGEDQFAAGTLQHDPAGRANLGADHLAGPLLGNPFAKVEAFAGRCRIGRRHVATVGGAEDDLTRAGADFGDRPCDHRTAIPTDRGRVRRSS